MTAAAIISGSLVDVRNVGTHKSVKLTIHVPEEHAMRVVAAFGWPTGVNPVNVAIARLDTSLPQQPPAVEAAPRPVTSGMEAPAGADKRKWNDLPYVQQAAIRCNEPVFRAFLREACLYEPKTADDAAEAVRELCGVASRSDIKPGTKAETRWLWIESSFDAWKTKDRVA